jgi:toxin ParE1/3/4
MARVIISNPAIIDIDEIANYISRDDPKIAKNFVQKLLMKIKLLEKFPELGKITHFIFQKNVRTLIHFNYRIFYRIDENVVQILRILHISRDFDESDLDE